MQYMCHVQPPRLGLAGYTPWNVPSGPARTIQPSSRQASVYMGCGVWQDMLPQVNARASATRVLYFYAIFRQ